MNFNNITLTIDESGKGNATIIDGKTEITFSEQDLHKLSKLDNILEKFLRLNTANFTEVSTEVDNTDETKLDSHVQFDVLPGQEDTNTNTDASSKIDETHETVCNGDCCGGDSTVNVTDAATANVTDVVTDTATDVAADVATVNVTATANVTDVATDVATANVTDVAADVTADVATANVTDVAADVTADTTTDADTANVTADAAIANVATDTATDVATVTADNATDTNVDIAITGNDASSINVVNIAANTTMA